MTKATARRPEMRRPLSEMSIEDLIGGRVLAWVGGTAIVVGLALLFALAVSHRWIGPGTRVALAGAGSLVLLIAGIWLHERRGRTDAAQAAASSAIAGLFGTVVAGTRVYHLLPGSAGIVLALAVGSLAVALALRWDGRGIAALGILGGLLSPVAVAAPSDALTIAFLWVGMLSACIVLVWRRWEWLGLAAFAAVSAQLVSWLFVASEPAATIALIAFAAVNAAMAIGFELRRREPTLRLSSAFLLAAGAATFGTAGWLALRGLDHPDAARLWLVTLAAAHLAGGLAGRRLKRSSADLDLACFSLGVILADLAFGLFAGGAVLAIGWSASMVLFAWLGGRLARDRDSRAAAAAVAIHLTLAVIRSTMVALAAHGPLPQETTASAILALASLAAACFVSGRLVARDRWRAAIDATGLAAVAYLSGTALHGAALVVAWSLESVALAGLARRTGRRLFRLGALAFLAGAAVPALGSAPPTVLVAGLDSPLPEAVALVAVALASVGCARLRPAPEPWPTVGFALGGALLVYAASALLITPFQPHTMFATDSQLILGDREEGQALMSTLWAVTGIVAASVGLLRERARLRLAALALILAAVAKVFLFDLATLSSIYRVGSFIAVGLLLLVGAFIWQRVRPRPLPDLRAVNPR